jgi:septal ring factor EnvC (AmiA/AmiB activator)
MEKNDITTKVLIGLVSVMLVAVIVLGYLLYKTSKEKDQIVVVNTETTNERDKIKAEFSNLLDQYNGLETTNDSLNAEINGRKQEIVKLIEELDKTKNWAAGMKKKYEEELGTLRSIMKHYVYQIDSLNTLNQQLTAENEMVRTENDRYKSENDELVDRNTELLTTIEDASIVNASHISIVFLNGRDKETNKSNKIEKLKVNFTLSANKLASSGQKTVYLRIKRPDGYLISSGATFTAGDTQLAYTDSRNITYDNQALDVSIYHKVNEQLTVGKYEVSLYMDGNKIGESSFLIEK